MVPSITCNAQEPMTALALEYGLPAKIQIYRSLKVDTTNLSAQSDLPKCPHCQSLARPNILMFNDYNWQPERSEIQENRFQCWKDNLLKTDQKLLVIEIGAGTAIP
jgi:NAD-dependent SIR2 family protein deacetylase